MNEKHLRNTFLTPPIERGSVKNQHFDTNTTTLIYLYLSLSYFPFFVYKKG